MGDLASSLRATAYVKMKAKKQAKQAAHRDEVASRMKGGARPTRPEHAPSAPRHGILNTPTNDPQ